MKQRIITALIASLFLVPAIIWPSSPYLVVGLSVCALFATYEVLNCTGLFRKWAYSIPCLIIPVVCPAFFRYFNSNYLNFIMKNEAEVADITRIERFKIFAFFFFFILIFVVVSFAFSVFSKGSIPLKDMATTVMALIYVYGGFTAILVLHDFFGDVGRYLYYLVFIGAWITDTFAYFCGYFFGRRGKHKLIPDVSPKKTWEGAIGGVVFCVLSFVLYAFIISKVDNQVDFHPIVAIVGGLIISIFAQIGDLSMSLLKRNYNVKDFGKIFPGHGGMLDRFDSILAVSNALLVFCSFFSIFEVI